MKDPTSDAEDGRAETPPWARLTEIEEYGRACEARIDHLVPVREPLALISQIQRSGGSLLTQLLDGHPECHAHPYELKIGHPQEWSWPQLDLAAPETWFSTLFEKKVVTHFVEGYRKPGTGTRDQGEVFPFLFLPRLQKRIFDACVASRPITRERDILNAYFTSYFNAWLDNHNLYSGPKRVVTGFAPRLNMKRASVEGFLAAYPDGTLISIVRDPRAWYASALAQRHPRRYADLEQSIGLWRRSAEAAIDAHDRFGDRVLVLTYEQLVGDTEATMRRVAERIGIAESPSMLMPTFNGRPIRANSSFAVARHGILSERIDAYRAVLDPAMVTQIDELAGDVHERAAVLAGRAPG